MEWDNVGLLVGRPGREVRRVLVALDITEAVADEAERWGAELIVAHHPVIFRGAKSVTDREPVGRTLLALLEGGISAVCMHTNLDVAPGGVNDALAEALGLEEPGPLRADGLGRVGTLAEARPLEAFAGDVCRILDCNGLRYADGGKPVRRVAVGGGACGDCIPDVLAAGCDTFVTADLSYHVFLDAAQQGLNLIDAGHFPTENGICGRLVSYLGGAFPDLEVRQSTVHREVIRYVQGADAGK